MGLDLLAKARLHLIESETGFFWCLRFGKIKDHVHAGTMPPASDNAPTPSRPAMSEPTHAFQLCWLGVGVCTGAFTCVHGWRATGLGSASGLG